MRGISLSGTIESLEVLELELGDLRTQLHETDQRIKNLEVENASLKSRIEEESKEIEALKTEIKFYSIGEPFGWAYYHRGSSDETIHSNDEWEGAEGYRRSRGDIILNLRHEIKKYVSPRFTIPLSGLPFVITMYGLIEGGTPVIIRPTKWLPY